MLAGELPSGRRSRTISPGLARELEQPLAFLVRLAVGAAGCSSARPRRRTGRSRSTRRRGLEDGRYSFEAGLRASRGRGPTPAPWSGCRMNGGTGNLGHVVGAVGPVAEHRLPGLLRCNHVRVGLVGVAQEWWLTKSETGTPSPRQRSSAVRELLLGAQPGVEDDRVPVLQPPVPEHELGRRPASGSAISAAYSGDLGERKVGWRVAHRRPQRAHAERLAQPCGGAL